MSQLLAIKYERGSLQLLDQRLLPFEFTYLDVPDPKTAWSHIKDMVVRGAPAIGVTGALALAVDLHNNKHQGEDFGSVAEAVTYITQTLDYLVTSRPTAVNLHDSAVKLKAVAARASGVAGSSPAAVVAAVVEAAEAMLQEDIAANKAMGGFGAEALLSAAAAAGKGLGGRVRVLTHCNTGSLATAGYGTALGVIRMLHEQGRLEHAYCTETRPYNQGARLTAFELHFEGIPSTLICDSAAAALMASGQVDAVVVGADRVAANGDSANKIGTYSLSIAAKHHGVPFFIAAPTTTLDPHMVDGGAIVIEQRPAEEITHFKGQRCVREGVQVWNSSFDVAPASLITGIVTEKGLIPKEQDAFQVRSFMQKLGLLAHDPAANGTSGDNGQGDAQLPANGFLRLYTDTVTHYILSHAVLQQKVGPSNTADSWTVREVGDGNINFVYIVSGPDGALCIKQSLPYVRCVGDSWPLTQDRARIEVNGLMEAGRHAPRHTPKVYHFDSRNAIIVMQYLAPPFIILRRGLLAGKTYPHVAEHIAEFLAQTLFNTSCFKLNTEEYRVQVTKYQNPELCKLTEQVIFTEPYTVAPNNSYLPALEPAVQQLQGDTQAKVAVSLLKERFIQHAEALLHGDLHTGSIMVTDSETYMIDPEFGYYGPMAFDVAKILANFMLTVFATYGLEQVEPSKPREEQRAWLLDTVTSIWRLFESKFSALWQATGLSGDLYPELVFGAKAPAGPQALGECQKAFFARLFNSVLGFAGAFIVRRIVGIAGVAEIREISDEAVRVAVERRALAFGQVLLKQVLKQSIWDIDTLVSMAADAAKPQQ